MGDCGRAAWGVALVEVSFASAIHSVRDFSTNKP
jgi:hypothetical protein